MIALQGKEVYLACGFTDLRKSINGLVALVEGSFRLDPFGGAIFAFCNRSRDRLKLVEWDGDGFWLHLKRLEKGHFKWPTIGENATMILSGADLEMLLGGAKVELKIRRKEVLERAAI